MPFTWLRIGAIQLDSKLALHGIIVPRGCAQTEGRLFNLSGQCQGHYFLNQRGNFDSIPCKIALEGLKPKFSRTSSEFSYSSTFECSNNFYLYILNSGKFPLAMDWFWPFERWPRVSIESLSTKPRNAITWNSLIRTLNWQLKSTSESLIWLVSANMSDFPQSHRNHFVFFIS